MHQNSKNSLGLLLLIAVVGGCAADSGRYPSLALRPFESGPVTPTPAPSVPIRPATSAIRLAELRAAATDSHTAFLAKEASAARLVRAASGQSFENRSRAAALVALADLDASRGATAGTLATVDALAADAAAALSAEPALVAAQSDIAAVLASEDASIARLWEMMGS